MIDEDPDRCTQILEDGTIYTFSIAHSTELAQQAMQNLCALQDQEPDFDFAAAVFSLFIDSIYILTDSGWTREELVQEVLTHSQAADSDFD